MVGAMSHDVLVDLTALDTSSRYFGTGRYIADLAGAIDALTPSERHGLSIGALTALSGPSPTGPLTWKGSPELRYPDGSWPRWLMDRRTQLALTLRRLAPRLFHATYSLGTPHAAGVPRVVTCLDLLRLVLHQDYLPGQYVYRHLLRGAEALRFHTARRVIAISQYTADDIVRLLGVPASRIDAIPLGVDLDRFRPPHPGPESDAAAAILRRRGLDQRPYFLHLGAADPRKNVDTLIHGFARAALPDVDLVLLGRLKPDHQARVDHALAAAGNPRGVRALGYIPDDELTSILSGALALPFTSSYEGFGFTPLEAMACGCPVIASPVTSIGEVVGDAALTVPPRDPDALAAAMKRMTAEPSLAGDLRRAGLARASRFTWRNTALATVDSYARALR